MLKIIVGSGSTQQNGWMSFEAADLDIRNPNEWRKLFEPGSIDAVLAEHVLEHLYPLEAEQVARNIFEYLKPGGYWRIAVPDAYNPNPAYWEHSRPGGVYQKYWHYLFADFPNHKVFYSIDTLNSLLTDAGFAIRPLEWYDRHGALQRQPWSANDGRVYRAIGTEYVKRFRLLLPFDNTSLIVDAIKPGHIFSPARMPFGS